MAENVIKEPSADELGKLIEESLSRFTVGEIVKGTVVRVQGNVVLVDLGWKSEGVLSTNEFTDPEHINEGDEVMVFVESLENREGLPVISKKKADFQMAWDTIKRKLENEEPCPALVRKKVKGGLQVEVFGLDAFLPGSQVDIRSVADFDSYIGDQIDVKIIKVNWNKRNIVVSRRMLLEEEMARLHKEALGKLEVDTLVKGTVKNIVDFGAFIDLGGLDALMHISDISWKKIVHPAEVLKVGEEIQVKILTKNDETGRVTVGLKQLTPHPWENIDKRYSIGSRVQGKVTSFTDYGAFVELEKGIEGLIHVSEMSWTRVVSHPAQILQIGQDIEAIVLSLDKENRRISLGLKQTTPDPWSVIEEHYHIGQRLEGVVSSLKNFGAFVELEEGIEGLIRNVDLSWTKRIKHPREILHKGDKIETIILDIDKESRRITLGLKQTQEDPFYSWSKEYKEGMNLSGKIIDMPSSGVVVALTEEIEGFVPQQQLRKRKIKKIKDHYELGDELQLTIRRIDSKARRVILSERDFYQKTVEKERHHVESIKAPKGFALKDHLEDALTTLKDAAGEKDEVVEKEAADDKQVEAAQAELPLEDADKQEPPEDEPKEIPVEEEKKTAAKDEKAEPVKAKNKTTKAEAKKEKEEKKTTKKTKAKDEKKTEEKKTKKTTTKKKTETKSKTDEAKPKKKATKKKEEKA
ncbi:S1 RNA-binding domain-containing protein [candidate division WOR-3 bacterium]|nr:S1 RNA-binding domain-containing protein [candidate division WOR-3 bacterium]